MIFKRLKYYTRLADLSIYRWDMLHKENDLRWLIKTKEPTKVKVNKLHSLMMNRVYQELIYQFDSLNLPLLRKKAEIAVRIIDFVIETLKTQNIQTIENASVIMRGLLAAKNPNIDWLYNVNIAETREQKWLITDLAVKIKQYNEQQKRIESREPLTLEQQLAKLNLGFHLNVKKTSVLQFIAYQNERIEQIKQIGNGKG